MRNKIVGIYRITSPSNKVYIGRSYDIKGRFRTYKRLDCKDQNKLFNSFIKYGVSNHIFEIVEILHPSISKDNISELELKHINNYNFEDLLNLSKDTRGVGRLNIEQCNKISNLHKKREQWNKGRFGSEHNRSKSIICINTNKIYGSISEASRELNIAISTIHHSISNNRKLRNGLHFQLNKI